MAETAHVMAKRLNGSLEAETSILDREVCDAQDRATGLQVLWQNCKNDLVAARLDAASAQRQLTSERTKLRQAKDQVSDLLAKIKVNDQQIKTLQRDLKQSEAKVSAMKDMIKSKDEYIAVINRELQHTKEKMMEKVVESENKSKELDDKNEEIRKLQNEMKIMKAEIHANDEKLKRWPFFMLSWYENLGSQTSLIEKFKIIGNKVSDFPVSMIKRIINSVGFR